ncbi:MAG: DUF4242 domain-containing protein [Syntrophaceae bacterium]|nr:DUF4242 domain-containing protein [Syntrophaceae bacterium]
MAKFLVVHPVGKDLTLEAVTPVAKAIKASLSKDAYWIKTSYAREAGNLYCEWDAKDADSIRDLFAKVAPGFPTSDIIKLDDAFHVFSEIFR